MRLFSNREEAGKDLANALAYLRGQEVVVMAVSNGALPIAMTICEALQAPLDMLVLATLPAPRHPEHIVGAVDEHGRISLIEQTARWHQITTQKMIGPARKEFQDLARRRSRIRSLLPEQEVRGKVVIVVNDGVSSGAAMLAAVSSVRDRGARKVIAAAPAGQQKAIWALHETADAVVIPHIPSKFRGVDKFYEYYPWIDDAAAVELIRKYLQDREIVVPVVTTIAMRFLGEGDRMIYCEADLPPGDGPFPAVVFAHGFDSDCRSPRNLPISRRLAKRGIIGVRIDFQGHGRSEGTREACTPQNMVEDLRTVLENLQFDERIDATQVGLCGSGTGGRIALEFAAGEPRIAALVVRGPVCGGEVDAARHVDAPTLLIHAESDIDLKEDVEYIDAILPSTHRLLRIPDCNRLFNDPISMELMASATVDWLMDHLELAARRRSASASVDKARSSAEAAVESSSS